MSLENPGSTIKVDSKGNAKEVPIVTREELLDLLDKQKKGLKGVIDHMSEVRGKMIKEGK